MSELLTSVLLGETENLDRVGRHSHLKKLNSDKEDPEDSISTETGSTHSH